MSVRIFRYPIDGPRFVLELPRKFEFLAVARNGTGPQLYFRVHDDSPLTRRTCFIVPTGAELTEEQAGADYAGTFTNEGVLGETLVWHVLIVRPESD